ncbi:PhzF family phenazine biosynthesis protein [Catalinimonas alkaloidigena]|uniref:PhzF family phenazine biosynthesis protein n=1 Tax=Catalinimonas alkaloidigena TaxID=1075417 RepID=UPI0024075561|nr:PhzF family phenazine biosynthesis protein [Catalinimonas alkaloidigena]MDF9794951.1 PhzF family phenazine biosynthesis protein [Catalinimonas alkaloidigena]
MHSPFALIEVFDDPARGFKGNTSTVVWLEKEIDEASMQSIAADFNQPATTFLWKSEEDEPSDFRVRWFAPDAEIGLCGHGSLAAIVYLSTQRSVEGTTVLHFPEGQLEGQMQEDGSASITLDGIPVLSEDEIPETLEAGLGIAINAYYSTPNKNIVLVESEAALRDMKPDFARLRELAAFGYAVTAPGDEVDFVSRTLVPHVQQLEDPATGSSHAVLAPFWGKKLDKKRMRAHQLSKRGGKFTCELLEDDNVRLSGKFSILAEGKLKTE